MNSNRSSGVVETALASLGRGFDYSSDFRLKYCKGDDRIILINETDTRVLQIPGFGSYDGVSVDIKAGKGDRTRYQSDILSFTKMCEFYNQKSRVPGKVPSGLFNSMFQYQPGSWAKSAENTRSLGLDGYFIELFNLQIDRYPLVLKDQVRDDVPSTWDPCALARFIKKYGTHVIVGLSIGGQDLVLAKQDNSSQLDPSEIKTHLHDLGDQLFNGTCNFSPSEHKHKVPEAFNVFDPHSDTLMSHTSITYKDGISVLCQRRGGDPLASTHCEWLLTVPSMPDALHFIFIPITSLLRGVLGRGFLSHAIDLYLRYKPPIVDLEYFLDFQVHKIWAPIHSDLPLGPIRAMAHKTPKLSFNLMGPKLNVNAAQVFVGDTPVTGLRLYLEGMKCNRLAIHLQHLVNTPTFLRNRIHGDSIRWRGSDEDPDADSFLEPVLWKKFSQICTAPVEFDERGGSVFIVTGAQLHVKMQETKPVLNLRLRFSRVSGCYVVQSTWMLYASDKQSLKSGFLSSISSSLYPKMENGVLPNVILNSAIFPGRPPVPVEAPKLLKYVDTAEMSRGPSDNPGHWLVTGAKLDLENGRICLRVKFSLLSLLEPKLADSVRKCI